MEMINIPAQTVKDFRNIASKKLAEVDYVGNMLMCQIKSDNELKEPSYKAVIDTKKRLSVGDEFLLQGQSVSVVHIVLGDNVRLEHKKTEQRSKEISDIKERTFYISKVINGEVEIACVREESGSYSVLPKYQAQFGTSQLSKEELIQSDVLVIGNSKAANEIRAVKLNNNIENNLTSEQVANSLKTRPKVDVKKSLAIRRP